MPLSKVERQVLELICDEHQQTRRGAKTSIVHVGMNAANSQQKARVVDVLLALKKRGLVLFGHEAWMPTGEGEGVLLAVASKASAQPKPVCDKCKGKIFEMEAEQYGDICNDCFKDMEEAPLPDALLDSCLAYKEEKAFSLDQIAKVFGVPKRFLETPAFSYDLLNRCAVMNATLLAQTKRDHEEGVPGAWRDMMWLVETGKQLLAFGGEA